MRSRYVTAAAGIGTALLATFLLLPAMNAVAAAGASTLTISGLTSGQVVTDTTFDASSFSWSVDATAGSTSGGGASAGKATFNPLLVRHELKGAEALLIKAAAEGRHLVQVQLVIQVGDTELVKFVLSDATITRAALSGKTAQPETSFSYRTVTVTTKGSSYCFDVALNAAC